MSLFKDIHKSILNTGLGFRHPNHDLEYADAATRLADTFVSDDIGKDYFDLDTKTFWRLKSVSAGVGTFVELGTYTGNVISALLTGFSAGAGTVAATDTILQAVNKIVGNIGLKFDTSAALFFKTISVSGQSDVVADSATDTLTLVAGSNVTITTDAATDTVTFSATPGAGGETTTSIGALINSATVKTTPVDADMLGLMDSADSNILKKLSWLNMKATLKTYFDTLYAALAGATFTGAVIHSDTNVSRANFLDCSVVTLAKGTINATGTVTFDYTGGSIQTLTCGGAYTLTWDFSNWPPTGNKGFVEVQATNMGLGTLAFSGTVNWKQKNDTYTTTFGTYLTDRGGETTLKSSGLDTFLFWSSDAGTTIYGVML